MPVERIFVHAGLQKTGSTAIQAALAGSRRELRRAGVSVWRIAVNHNAPLRIAFGRVTPRRAAEWYGRFGDREKVRRHLANAIERSQPSFLITSELLSTAAQAELATLRDWLRETAPNARLSIVVYVRRVDRHLSSFVQQQIRRGYTISQAIADTKIISYRDRIGVLFDVFGRDEVDVRLCPEIDEQGPNALLADFANAVGLPFQPRPTRDRQNNSLSQAACQLLDEVNGAIGKAPRDVQLVQRFLPELRASLPGPAFRLPALTLRDIAERHRSDIEWLSKNTGIDLELPSDLPPDGSIPQVDTERLAKRLMAAFGSGHSTDAAPPA